jgi:hypothetical protein
VALVLVVGCGRFGFDSEGARGDGDIATLDSADGASVDGDTFVPARVTFVKASNTETFDNFGWAVALSRDGTTLAVSALQEDSSATTINGSQTDDTAPQSGAVYVFTRSGATWAQQAYLKPANTGSGDVFGWSLAISDDGNRVVVGSPLEDSDTTGVNPVSTDPSMTFDAGAAYVFSRTGTTWAQEAFLKATNTGGTDDFGVAVAIAGNGTTVAIGAGNEDSNSTGINQDTANNSATDAGAVFIYDFAAAWTFSAYLKASNTDAGDRFGTALALSADGNTLAVGTPAEDSGAMTIGGIETDNSVTEAGAVYVFTRSGVTWSQQEYIKPSQLDFGDFFGNRLALSSDGSTLVAVAPGNDSTIANSGTSFVFSRSGVTWSELTILKAPNAGDNDQFGFDVAISGDSNAVIVGAGYEDGGGTGVDADPADNSSQDSGAAYVWGRASGADYTFAAYTKPPVLSVGDQFGASVAMSYDHRTAAISMPYEDSGTNGVNGSATDESASDSGAVYILEN